MKVIELIPYKNFKQKISITKLYKGAYVEVMDKFIYVERWNEDV